MGRLKHEALREEVHCFVDLNDIRGCPDRQRSDRSAAMHMLHRNIDPALISNSITLTEAESRPKEMSWARVSGGIWGREQSGRYEMKIRG
ncbi:hypothetical protein [Rhizobium leguminosarum]|uniref:hypothetical protein n=1 Tax=Rhizobium leguminosarum TaxID=384 RepID=UPI0014425FDA|nr:hypothetical protein [Rhizobium leguminosarum]